jgi:hypothetical protein
MYAWGDRKLFQNLSGQAERKKERKILGSLRFGHKYNINTELTIGCENGTVFVWLRI